MPVRTAPSAAPATAPTKATKDKNIAGVKAAALGTNAIRLIPKLIELSAIPLLFAAMLRLPLRAQLRANRPERRRRMRRSEGPAHTVGELLHFVMKQLTLLAYR